MLSSHSQKEKYFFKGLLFKAHYDFFSQQVASVQKEAFLGILIKSISIDFKWWQDTYTRQRNICGHMHLMA